jgi:hypothetical protein
MPRPWRLQRQRGGLRQDDGVEARHVPADEVGEAQPRGAAPARPGAVAVGAEGQHQRRLQHHRLLEVQAVQACLRAGSVVFTTDTMFRLPLDELPCSDSTSTRSTSAGSTVFV